MIYDPTRVCEKSETLIDHVYTTKPENITYCHVPIYAISDHYPICINRKINMKLKKESHIEITYRCFKKLKFVFAAGKNDVSPRSPHNSLQFKIDI